MTEQMTVEAAIANVERCKFVRHENFTVTVIDDGTWHISDRQSRREIVHCFLGSMGADWDVEDVVALIKRSESRSWQPVLLAGGECLIVDSGGKRYSFDDVKPMTLEA